MEHSAPRLALRSNLPMDWVVTDDIYRETWRRVLEFANVDLTVDEIARQHGSISEKNRANYQKQARQVRVCALQAKEYFDAARASSVFTSPNQAYYGAVSLASVMTLILGDGTKSLDYLRKDTKNRHHGLDFSTGCDARSASSGLCLIERSFARVLERGHFANWYTCLPTRGISTAVVRRQEQAGSGTTGLEIVGGFEVKSIERIVGEKWSLMNLLRHFPDLSSELYRYSVGAPRSRTSHEVHFRPNQVTRHTWLIHPASCAEERDAILAQFAVHPRFIECMSQKLTEGAPGAIVTVQWTGKESPSFKWPTARETLNHDTISYGADIDVHEIVDLYIVAYQLGMLSRYYPDLWISCVESQCKAAKLIERAVDIIVQKLPILALSMLTPGGLTISTHRPPWVD